MIVRVGLRIDLTVDIGLTEKLFGLSFMFYKNVGLLHFRRESIK